MSRGNRQGKLNTVPLRLIRFSESSFHRPEAAEKKFVSYIPFLIRVNLVSRLHAIRFTRLHETKLCLRLRACRQVCRFIVGLSKRMVMTGAALPHAAPCRAVPRAVPRSHANSCRANSCCSAHSMLPPCHPPPTTPCHLHPACNHPASCSSRNHGLGSRHGPA
jgi:hypothetical protein